MDFLKKNYEKILLGVMLVGLIGVLIFMLFFIASDKEEMADKRNLLTHPHVNQLTNLDTTSWDSAAARLEEPFNLDLETTNKLFNPMEWQKALDGTLIPAAKKTGVRMVVVNNITPLYLIVSLDSVSTNELGAGYFIKVERQAAANPQRRRAARHYASLSDKLNDTFELLQVKGAADDPAGLVLKMQDSGDVITISKNHPYRHIEGYSADFRYDPERKVFRAKRVGDKVSFGGEDYEVVDVNSNELILSDQSNQKKTSLPLVP